MDKILSVIVPSYNMEPFLEKGLQSLIIGKGLPAIEIIVVNDGSTDRTLSIAMDFREKYPDNVTVIDKKNGNYGSCVNAGLAVAVGKYVRILDADDYVDTEAFEALVDCLENTDADVIVCDYRKIYSGRKQEDFTFSFPAQRTVKIEDIYSEKSFSTILLPALTYRLSILKKMNYRQTEGISYTDTEWCYSPMTQMSTLYYFNKPVYMYVMGREGQTMDPAIFRSRIPQLLHCMYSLMSSLDNLVLSPWANRFAVEQLVKHCIGIYRFFLIEHPEMSRQPLREFDSALKLKKNDVYEICGNAEYRKKIPYRFIEEWRSGRSEIIPVPVRCKEIVFDFLGTIHYYILRIFNPDLKR